MSTAGGASKIPRREDVNIRGFTPETRSGKPASGPASSADAKTQSVAPGKMSPAAAPVTPTTQRSWWSFAWGKKSDAPVTKQEMESRYPSLSAEEKKALLKLGLTSNQFSEVITSPDIILFDNSRVKLAKALKEDPALLQGLVSRLDSFEDSTVSKAQLQFLRKKGIDANSGLDILKMQAITGLSFEECAEKFVGNDAPRACTALMRRLSSFELAKMAKTDEGKALIDRFLANFMEGVSFEAIGETLEGQRLLGNVKVDTGASTTEVRMTDMLVDLRDISDMGIEDAVDLVLTHSGELAVILSKMFTEEFSSLSTDDLKALVDLKVKDNEVRRVVELMKIPDMGIRDAVNLIRDYSDGFTAIKKNFSAEEFSSLSKDDLMTLARLNPTGAEVKQIAGLMNIPDMRVEEAFNLVRGYSQGFMAIKKGLPEEEFSRLSKDDLLDLAQLDLSDAEVKRVMTVVTDSRKRIHPKEVEAYSIEKLLVNSEIRRETLEGWLRAIGPGKVKIPSGSTYESYSKNSVDMISVMPLGELQKWIASNYTKEQLEPIMPPRTGASFVQSAKLFKEQRKVFERVEKTGVQIPEKEVQYFVKKDVTMEQLKSNSSQLKKVEDSAINVLGKADERINKAWREDAKRTLNTLNSQLSVAEQLLEATKGQLISTALEEEDPAYQKVEKECSALKDCIERLKFQIEGINTRVAEMSAEEAQGFSADPEFARQMAEMQQIARGVGVEGIEVASEMAVVRTGNAFTRFMGLFGRKPVAPTAATLLTQGAASIEHAIAQRVQNVERATAAAIVRKHELDTAEAAEKARVDAAEAARLAQQAAAAKQISDRNIRMGSTTGDLENIPFGLSFENGLNKAITGTLGTNQLDSEVIGALLEPPRAGRVRASGPVVPEGVDKIAKEYLQVRMEEVIRDAKEFFDDSIFLKNPSLKGILNNPQLSNEEILQQFPEEEESLSSAEQAELLCLIRMTREESAKAAEKADLDAFLKAGGTALEDLPAYKALVDIQSGEAFGGQGAGVDGLRGAIARNLQARKAAAEGVITQRRSAEAAARAKAVADAAAARAKAAADAAAKSAEDSLKLFAGRMGSTKTDGSIREALEAVPMGNSVNEGIDLAVKLLWGKSEPNLGQIDDALRSPRGWLPSFGAAAPSENVKGLAKDYLEIRMHMVISALNLSNDNPDAHGQLKAAAENVDLQAFKRVFNALSREEKGHIAITSNAAAAIANLLGADENSLHTAIIANLQGRKDTILAAMTEAQRALAIEAAEAKRVEYEAAADQKAAGELRELCIRMGAVSGNLDDVNVDVDFDEGLNTAVKGALNLAKDASAQEVNRHLVDINKGEFLSIIAKSDSIRKVVDDYLQVRMEKVIKSLEGKITLDENKALKAAAKQTDLKGFLGLFGDGGALHDKLGDVAKMPVYKALVGIQKGGTTAEGLAEEKYGSKRMRGRRGVDGLSVAVDSNLIDRQKAAVLEATYGKNGERFTDFVPGQVDVSKLISTDLKANLIRGYREGATLKARVISANEQAIKEKGGSESEAAKPYIRDAIAADLRGKAEELFDKVINSSERMAGLLPRGSPQQALYTEAVKAFSGQAEAGRKLAKEAFVAALIEAVADTAAGIPPPPSTGFFGGRGSQRLRGT